MADDFTVVKNERGKAAVWTFMGLKKRKSDNQIDEKVAVCTTCNAQVKMAGGGVMFYVSQTIHDQSASLNTDIENITGGTSNMQAHIRRHHSSMLTSKLRKMPKHTDQCSPADQGKSQADEAVVCRSKQTTLAMAYSNNCMYKSDSVKAGDITEKIAKFLVKDLRPYSMVDCPFFRQMVHALDPRYKVPGRKQFSEVIIPAAYDRVKEDLQAMLRRAVQVCFYFIFIFQ